MIEFRLMKRNADNTAKYTVNEIGIWLDNNMPNPYIEKGAAHVPRWELKTFENSIVFFNDEDATWFGLMFP